jgi:hypothetical protein
MARLIPASERVTLARELIQQARDYPIPDLVEGSGGRHDFSYVAHVKDLLRQARDMVKFIPQSAGASAETKAEAKKIFDEIELADREILHKPE